MELLDLINNWVDLTQSPYCLEIKKSGPYTLYKYDQIKSDFSLPAVRQARGIIIDDNNRVVCRPFDKFFNYGEQRASDIDWDTARVQEKVDGSLIKLRYDNDCWVVSTNNTIYADEAMVWLNWTKCFQYLFWEALYKNGTSYSDLLPNLDKDYTYMFELVSPESTVVIEYDLDIYHIWTRRNSDGQEIDTDIWIKKPKEYLVWDTKSLEVVLKERDNLEWLHEGFVVVDDKFNRIKVKTDDYVKLHHEYSWPKSKYWLIDLIQEWEIDEYLSYFPSKKDLIEEMKNKIDSFKAEVEKIKKNVVEEREQLLKKNWWDIKLSKKEFALAHKDDDLKNIMFRVFDDKELILDYKKYYNE